MSVTSTSQPRPNAMSNFAGTREEFVRTLRALGAAIEPAGGGDPAHHALHMSFRCSAEDWVKVFGEVKILGVQFGPGGRPAFQAWAYQCTDGLVLCVGCQYQRRDGTNWVMVKAVYFS